MLSEQIVEIIGEEHYKRISHKLDSLLVHHTDMTIITSLMLEIATLSYVKGRKDERYYSKGPNISYRNDKYNKEESG